jgi:hypothetical protein
MFSPLSKFRAERHGRARPALAKPLALATIVAILVAAAFPSQAQFAPKIPLAKLQAMFATMRAQGRVNVDGPLRWGYYFLDPDRAKLDALAAELHAKGYRLVGLAKDDRRALFRLHVERIELMTAESLYARDIELETLVRRFHVLSYDGMDVGPAPAAASAASP